MQEAKKEKSHGDQGCLLQPDLLDIYTMHSILKVLGGLSCAPHLVGAASWAEIPSIALQHPLQSHRAAGVTFLLPAGSHTSSQVPASCVSPAGDARPYSRDPHLLLACLGLWKW